MTAITFLAYRTITPFPTYLLTVGTYINNGDDEDDDIKTSIKQLLAGLQVLPIIRSLVAGNSGIRADQVDGHTNAILSSIKVTLAHPPKSGIVANIYCASPTTFPDHW